MSLGLGLGIRLPLAAQPRTAGGGGPAAKTYADFRAHIATLATAGAINWTDGLSLADGSLQKYRTTSGAFSGDLYGSPEQARCACSGGAIFSSVARIVQHSLPDGDLSGATAGREVYFEVAREISANPALTGKTINGYSSLSTGAGVVGSGFVTRIIWWNGTGAMTRDPSAGTGPTPYVIP